MRGWRGRAREIAQRSGVGLGVGTCIGLVLDLNLDRRGGRKEGPKKRSKEKEADALRRVRELLSRRITPPTYTQSRAHTHICTLLTPPTKSNRTQSHTTPITASPSPPPFPSPSPPPPPFLYPQHHSQPQHPPTPPSTPLPSLLLTRAQPPQTTAASAPRSRCAQTHTT